MSDSQLAVDVERLGKHYFLGQKKPIEEIRTGIARLARRVSRANRPEIPASRSSLWALRDVTFGLPRGETLGVIGHNGAGKSTLLKLLSRVTAPTEGRAILRGRAAALLEVGTGFHPELTGRENVFLNGAVLGMPQAEIRGRFDDIVDFSEVGRFIDTPIKRYSTGMQVRLAFAVAAFLEPDILIIDEVLAVGDVAFQRRCLGKLGATSLEGRTVIFVSHNLPAIRTLCPRSILLDHGSLIFGGPTDEAIDRYVSAKLDMSNTWDLRNADRPALDMRGRVRFTGASLVGATEVGGVPVGEPLTVRIHFNVLAPIEAAVIVLNLSTPDDVLVAQSVTTSAYPPVVRVEPGPHVIAARFEAVQLQPGRYSFGFGARSSAGLEDQVSRAGMVEFVESVELESPWFGGAGGYLRLPVEWSEVQRTANFPSTPTVA